MACAVPSVELSDGRKMPLVGLGTWQGSQDVDNDAVAENVRLAIEVGYRLIDTAQMYNTEPGVGRGIRDAIERGTVSRQDIFVTTKLWATHHRRPDVVRHLRKSLDRLGLDYVDLYLIHWPCALKSMEEDGYPKDESGKHIYEDIDLLETWKGMEDAVDQGLTRSIGVSNFNKRQVERILANCRIKPVNNQVEVNLGFQNLKLTEFCHSSGISITGHRTMLYLNDRESPSALNLEVVRQMADRHGKTPQQIAQKYQVQRGIAVIPKSSNEKRLRQNMELFDFELTKEELAALNKLDANKRSMTDVEFLDANEYPFSDDY